jgi:predicted DNA repair protein MutK
MNEVADESIWVRAQILVVVSVAITVLVYGAVGLIVKMDDIGVHLTTKDSPRTQRFGQLLVKGMPAVLGFITFIGTVAMLWVGGHIMLQGAYDLGWHAPYDLVHLLESPFAGVPAVGGLLAWLVNTLCSAILGLVWGLVVMAILHPLLKVLPFGKDKAAGEGTGEHEEGDLRAAIAGHRPAGRDPRSGTEGADGSST